MATLDEARAAQAKAKRMHPGATVGISGTGSSNYTVRIGMPGGTALQAAPGDIDGVPVYFVVAPPVRKLDEDGEHMRQIMRRMLETMAENYETSGHPNCPLCGQSGDSSPPHLDDCDFGNFLSKRREARGA